MKHCTKKCDTKNTTQHRITRCTTTLVRNSEGIPIHQDIPDTLFWVWKCWTWRRTKNSSSPPPSVCLDVSCLLSVCLSVLACLYVSLFFVCIVSLFMLVYLSVCLILSCLAVCVCVCVSVCVLVLVCVLVFIYWKKITMSEVLTFTFFRINFHVFILYVFMFMNINLD